MTTLATNGLVLATDSLSVYGGEPVPRDAIKYTITDGFLFTIAGTRCLLDPFIKWFLAGAKPELYPRTHSTDITFEVWVMYRDPNGVHGISYNHECPYADPMVFPAATGTGRKYALGAMYAGLSPAEAVRIATKLDVHSREPVQEIDLYKVLKPLKIGGSKMAAKKPYKMPAGKMPTSKKASPAAKMAAKKGAMPMMKGGKGKC